jgi:glutamyl-tRNA reductase
VHPLEELPLRLAAADLVFVATSAGRRLLSGEQVSFALQGRPGRRLVLFDLSVPRNVDPDVQQTTGVRLLDLDDLQSAEQRDTSDMAAVELAVLVAAESFCAEVRSRTAGPLIAALRNRIEEVCLDQLQRAARGHALTDEALARMASSVAGAVAHSPTLLARNAAAEGDLDSLALLAAAFRLEGVTSDA